MSFHEYPSKAFSAEAEKTRISEGLSAAEVQAVIKADLSSIRHCYEQLLEKSPKAKGKFVVDFKIAVDGKVASSKISSDTIPSITMGECVLKKVNLWKFPARHNGKTVDVSYPFAVDPL